MTRRAFAFGVHASAALFAIAACDAASDEVATGPNPGSPTDASSNTDAFQ